MGKIGIFLKTNARCTLLQRMMTTELIAEIFFTKNCIRNLKISLQNNQQNALHQAHKRSQIKIVRFKKRLGIQSKKFDFPKASVKIVHASTQSTYFGWT